MATLQILTATATGTHADLFNNDSVNIKQNIAEQ